jgi:aminocarboxymuconate-semialdehyde decarboxylase
MVEVLNMNQSINADQIIDMHSHYWPEAMVTALKSGKTWHGWKLSRSQNGKPSVSRGNRTAPFEFDPYAGDLGLRRSKRLELEKITTELLMVPSFLWGYEFDPVDAAAMCRDINREMADATFKTDGSAIGLGVLPLQDPELTRKEIEFAVKELGITAFSIGTSVTGKSLDDPVVKASLAALFETGLPIVLHGVYFDRIGADRLPNYYFGNSFSVPLETSVALMSLIYSGLPDQFPELRLASSHGGGWIHYGLGRFEMRLAHGHDRGSMRGMPSDYLQRFYYDCLVHDPDTLEFLIKKVGISRILIGTDFPFGGDIIGGSSNWINSLDFLKESDKKAILHSNALEFLKK